MSRQKCILAIKKPQIENWMCGTNTEGRLAQTKIWEEIEVVDMIQDQKDIIASIENHPQAELIFISKQIGNASSLKVILSKCKQFYPNVRIILLLWDASSDDSQMLIHHCVNEKITSDLVVKVSTGTIYNALHNKMSYEEAEKLKIDDDKYTAILPSSSTATNAPRLNNIDLEREGISNSESEKTPAYDVNQNAVSVLNSIDKNEIEDQMSKPSAVEEKVKPAPNDAPVQEKERPVQQEEKLINRPDIFNTKNVADGGPVLKPNAHEDKIIPGPGINGSKNAEGGQKSAGFKDKFGSIIKNGKNIIPLPGDKTAEPKQPAKESFQSPTERSPFGGSAQSSDNSPFFDSKYDSFGSQAPKTESFDVRKSIKTQFMNQKVVTFWSPKAIGKTTLLSNVAVQAAKFGMKAIAIDMNTFTHDLGAYFGLPRKTPGLERLLLTSINEDAIASLINKRCGVDILTTGMERLRYDLDINVNQINQILSSVTRKMDYNLILVDVCSIIDEIATATILDQADVIYLVVDQNKSFLEDIANDLIIAEEMVGIPREKFRLVINNYTARCDMSQNRIENYLKMKAVAVVPSDRYGHIQAVNYGKPYCINKTEDAAVWNALLSDAIGKPIGSDDSFWNKMKFW